MTITGCISAHECAGEAGTHHKTDESDHGACETSWCKWHILRRSMAHLTVCPTWQKECKPVCSVKFTPQNHKFYSANQKLQTMPSYPGADKGLYQDFANLKESSPHARIRYQAEQDGTPTSASCDRKNCLPVSRPFFSAVCCSARLQAKLR